MTTADILIEEYEATQKVLHKHLLPLLKDYTVFRHELYGNVDPNLLDELPYAVFFSTNPQDYTFIIEDYENQHGDFTEFYPVYLPFAFANDPEGYKDKERKRHSLYKASKDAQERFKSENRIALLKAEIAKEEAKLSGPA